MINVCENSDIKIKINSLNLRASVAAIVAISSNNI